METSQKKTIQRISISKVAQPIIIVDNEIGVDAKSVSLSRNRLTFLMASQKCGSLIVKTKSQKVEENY